MNKTNHHPKWSTSGVRARYRGDRGMGRKGESHYEQLRGEIKPWQSSTLPALEARLAAIDKENAVLWRALEAAVQLDKQPVGPHCDATDAL